jgi:hypothetical protein
MLPSTYSISKRENYNDSRLEDNSSALKDTFGSKKKVIYL